MLQRFSLFFLLASCSPVSLFARENLSELNKNRNPPSSGSFFSTTDWTPHALWCLEGNHITSTPHALRCLEGTTLSNRGQRPRIHDTPPSICLEGSTPQDRFTFYSYHGFDGFDGFSSGGNRSKSFYGLRRLTALGLPS